MSTHFDVSATLDGLLQELNRNYYLCNQKFYFQLDEHFHGSYLVYWSPNKNITNFILLVCVVKRVFYGTINVICCNVPTA